MATFSQTPGQLDIRAVVGTDFVCFLRFDTIISTYTFEGFIVLQEYPTKKTYPISIIVTGDNTIGLELTDAQTAEIGPISKKKWYLNWITNGLKQTVLSGNFELSDIPIGINTGNLQDVQIKTFDIDVNVSSVSTLGATGATGPAGIGVVGATGVGSTGATGATGIGTIFSDTPPTPVAGLNWVDTDTMRIKGIYWINWSDWLNWSIRSNWTIWSNWSYRSNRAARRYRNRNRFKGKRSRCHRFASIRKHGRRCICSYIFRRCICLVWFCMVKCWPNSRRGWIDRCYWINWRNRSYWGWFYWSNWCYWSWGVWGYWSNWTAR
jgi:hypothetical protein